MSTFKDARTVLLESYLDGVIDDDKFILLCDETLKKPKFPYEFFFIFTWNNDIKIQKYRNNTLNSSSATCFFFPLFSIWSSVLSREGCSDLELPFCQLWNKQLQFGSSFQRPLFFSFSRNSALFCSSDFPAQHFIVKKTPYHQLPKNIRIQFRRINL